MFKRSWVFIAAFGLIVSVGLGQAQEQTQGEQRQTEDQHEPSGTSILRDIVIEYQAATDARQRREEEARQREIDDLIAQQGMNAATQAMQVATEKMRSYSLIQTWLIAIGTFLLLATLLLTLGANKATWQAVRVQGDIGNKQLRAYVGYSHIDIRGVAEETDYDLRTGIRFMVVFVNHGLTPAKKVMAVTINEIIGLGASAPVVQKPTDFHHTGFLGANIGPNQTHIGGWIQFKINDIAYAKQNNLIPIIAARIDYVDIFGAAHFHEVCVAVDLVGDPQLLYAERLNPPDLFSYPYYGPNNRSDQD